MDWLQHPITVDGCISDVASLYAGASAWGMFLTVEIYRPILAHVSLFECMSSCKW